MVENAIRLQGACFQNTFLRESIEICRRVVNAIMGPMFLFSVWLRMLLGYNVPVFSMVENAIRLQAACFKNTFLRESIEI